MLEYVSVIIRSTLRQRRPNKAGLICPSMNPYGRPSTYSFCNFNDIWHVGRGQ